MPLCKKCGKRLSRVDMPNHDFSEHTPPAKQDAVRAQVKRQAEKRERTTAAKWDAMSEGERSEFWDQLVRGE